MGPRPILLALLTAACAAEPATARPASMERRFAPRPAPDHTGVEGAPGPPLTAGTTCQAWSVTRAWTEVRSDGLTWEELFATWVGRVGSAPLQDQAEILLPVDSPLLLRAAFASRYALPFFVEAWDRQTAQVIHAGHFGVVDASGRCMVVDDEGRGSPGLAVLFPRPRPRLLARFLHTHLDGANLADDANTFHVLPERTRAGDVLLERWDREGAGHTLSVARIDVGADGRMAVEVVLAGAPGTPPTVAGPADARWYFTLATAGGPGHAADGTPYAALGGGLRRWRTAVATDSRWRNVVLQPRAAGFLDSRDLQAIAARPARFGELLADSPRARPWPQAGEITAGP